MHNSNNRKFIFFCIKDISQKTQILTIKNNYIHKDIDKSENQQCDNP